MLAAACGEPPSGPEAPLSPTFAEGGKAACPTPADHVVSDEESLFLALAKADPGDVIGLDRYFGVTKEVVVEKENVTLTCATPGSGLYAQEGVFNYVVRALAEGVTVERLVLDGSGAASGPFLARDAANVRFSNNTVTCGPYICAFFIGTPGAAVFDNYFESANSVRGVHFTAPNAGTPRIDGSRIERNIVVRTGPPRVWYFGGIRVRDGTGVVVTGNRVKGPWQNSIHVTNVLNSQFKNNKLEGADRVGIYMTGWAPTPDAFSNDNVFRNNKITGAGLSGIWVARSCGNVFLGNNLNGNGFDRGVFFALRSGANTLVFNENVVIDNGNHDCDQSGEIDPNIINGSGAVQHGVQLGDEVSDAADSWNDVG